MSPGTIPTARPLRKLAYSRGLAVGMVCGESRASDEREAFGGCSPDDGGMVCGESRASDEREAIGGCSPDDGGWYAAKAVHPTNAKRLEDAARTMGGMVCGKSRDKMHFQGEGRLCSEPNDP